MTLQFPLLNNQLLDRVRGALPASTPAFLVGGAVRDMLLGNTTHDLDIALAGDALAVAIQVANKLGGAYFPLDEEHGAGRVVMIAADGSRYHLDFTTFRGPDLEADLRARDFTINALALDVHQPQAMIDPLGGAADLKNKLLRACSATTFSADPLRTLRAVRLATTLRFRITMDTQSSLLAAVSHLDQISPERLRDELFRILEGPSAFTAIQLLDRFQILPHVLPELEKLKGVAQSAPHTDDVWVHTIQTMRHLQSLLQVLGPVHDPDASADLMMGLVTSQLGRYRQLIDEHLKAELTADRPGRALLFLGALYHDIGKPQTQNIEADGTIRFFEHPQVGAELIRSRGRQLRLSNPEIQRLETIVHHHMRPLLLAQDKRPPTRRATFRFFRDTGEGGVDICLLSLADTLGTYGSSLPQQVWVDQIAVVRKLLEAWWEQRETQVSPEPLLKGGQLIEALDLKPGPQVGRLYQYLLEAQASGEIKTRAQALELARRWLEEMGHNP